VGNEGKEEGEQKIGVERNMDKRRVGCARDTHTLDLPPIHPWSSLNPRFTPNPPLMLTKP
jgi:hypothetical protein